MTTNTELLQSPGVALGLGLLVGLQREPDGTSLHMSPGQFAILFP